MKKKEKGIRNDDMGLKLRGISWLIIGFRS